MKCYDFFDADIVCNAVILTSDPSILKMCGMSGVTGSNYVPTLIQIDQPAAELLTI